MRSVQEKFFDLLEERAIKERLELVLHKEWSNVGTLHLQDPKSSATYLTTHFAFNKLVSLGQRGGDNPRIFTGRPNQQFALFTASELDEAIDYLIDYALASRGHDEDSR